MKLQVYHYLIVIILLSSIQLCYAKTDKNIFDITTGERVYAIGHPIDVIFETQNHPQSLSTLNLDILEKNFVIHDYNIDKFEDDSTGELIRIESLVVRLYPKRAGNLIIPVFKLGKYTSKKIRLNIVNDFNSSIQIRTTTTKKSYLQREPINIYVDIYFRQKKITSSIGKFSNKNFIISDLVTTEYTVKENKKISPVKRYSWIVIPLTEGEQVINLPMVKTGGRRMYPSGQLKLNVISLPSTLPISVPVSKQIITNQQMPQDKIWINKVYFWSVSITGIGLNENTLDKILTPQLQSNSNIRYFPRIYTITRIKNATKFKIDVKIPYKLYNSGSFQFPNLDIPYIDTNTGIIEHTYSGTSRVHATSAAIEDFKVILIICLFFIVLLIPVLKLLKRVYIKHQYKKCYKSISVTNNPKRLKKYIFNLTPNFSSNETRSIKSWQESAALIDPDQRKILIKISALLNNFNYGVHHTENEVVALKRLVKQLS